MGDKTDKAVAVLTRDYLAEVNRYAKDYIEEIKKGEYDDRDDFLERLDEDIDGAQRVIYTWRARLGLLVSDNHDIGIDELGAEGFDWSQGIPYSALMYFAFRADIVEAMGRFDFDVNDDDKAGSRIEISFLRMGSRCEGLRSLS